jgi:protein-disulfide isomerase
MMEKALNRRTLIAGTAGVLASAALPRWAAALPSIEEIANDPAIPALANPQGDITLVEFVDYQCPYCKLCYLEIMKLVAEDPGIRLVMKDWPIFGGVSVHAARAMVASFGDRNYPSAVAGLMANNRYLSKRRVERILREAGIERTDLEESIASGQPGIDALLDRNIAQAHALGLTGTPGLLVGPILYKHGLGIEKLRRAVAFVRSGEGSYPT